MALSEERAVNQKKWRVRARRGKREKKNAHTCTLTTFPFFPLSFHAHFSHCSFGLVVRVRISASVRLCVRLCVCVRVSVSMNGRGREREWKRRRGDGLNKR